VAGSAGLAFRYRMRYHFREATGLRTPVMLWTDDFGIPALHPRSCGRRLQTRELDHAELPGPFSCGASTNDDAARTTSGSAKS
jgi:hypothetical protein